MEIKLFGTLHRIGKNQICPHKFKYQHTMIKEGKAIYSSFSDSYTDLFVKYLTGIKNNIKWKINKKQNNTNVLVKY